MRSLNRGARLYLYTIWLIAALVVAFLLSHSPMNVPLLWLCMWSIGYALADYFEVTFETGNHTIAMTLAEAITIFLVVAGGTSSIFVIILGTGAVELVRQRVWYKALFNIATRVITISAMVLIYSTLHTPNTPPFSTPSEILAFFAMALCFYVSSAVIIGLMVAFATNAPVQEVYQGSYQVVQWIHLLTMPIGALMAAHWESNRVLLIFDIVVLLIAQRSFIMVAQLQTESLRRKELADERERLLEELKERQEELIRASKLAALGTFSSGIAHEFNNLLTVILGQAQIGLMTDDPIEMRESLEHAAHACRRGRSITQGLLTFARQGESQRVMTTLNEVIGDTIHMVERDFSHENVRIISRLDQVAPTACDPGQILQVLLNLLTNARDAMRSLGGGVITVELHQEDDQIVLIVADTGGGIPLEIQDQIFQPFVTTKGNQGTGLGLAICYGIIESHNGSIRVDSVVGSGTSFTIRLPLVEYREPAIRMTATEAARFTSATSQESLRIYN